MQRFEAKVIENQQVRPEVGLDFSPQGAIGTTAVDVLQHLASMPWLLSGATYGATWIAACHPTTPTCS
jgi:hypothetical protein